MRAFRYKANSLRAYPTHTRQESRITTPLKTSNSFALGAVLAANLIVYLGLLFGNSLFQQNLSLPLPKWSVVLPATFLIVAVGVINAFFSATAKARLIFLRWNHPLPGSRAFSKLAKTDTRIDLDKLRTKTGRFPKAPAKQNAVWYSLYKSIENDPAVSQVHKSYLLTRDYAVFAVLLVPILGTLAFVQFPTSTMALSYMGFLIVQFVLVVRAARTHGFRFVTTVLARKSAEP